MQATVNISLSELQELQKAREAAEQEAATLREQIRQAKIDTSDHALLIAARASIEVVRFAVSQLPPESTKGWPADALKLLAAHLVSLPDATPDDEELATTLTSFAVECETFENRRRVMGNAMPVSQIGAAYGSTHFDRSQDPNQTLKDANDRLNKARNGS